MDPSARLICDGSELVDAGVGVRFSTQHRGEAVQAFVIRHKGRVYGYLNQCGHVPAELDWKPGEFFDYSKLYLVCTVHGALYSPTSGRCLSGRCAGRGLVPLAVAEREGKVYLLDPDQTK